MEVIVRGLRLLGNLVAEMPTHHWRRRSPYAQYFQA